MSLPESRPFALERRGARLLLTWRDGDGAAPVAVRAVWPRPLSGRNQEIALVGPEKKELALLPGLEAVADPAARELIREQLGERYLMPVILRVRATRPNFGARYWDVETDQGPRRFVMKDPTKNAQWLGPDRLVLRDTLGSTYEIPAFSRLDPRSRAEAEKVL